MSTIVSAPGKVLIAGGYLVLDPAYSGVVVSTSSRFYTVIRSSESIPANTILVRSPQFDAASWKYVVKENGDVVPDESNTSKNKFVHLALQNTLTLASQIHNKPIQLEQGLDIAIVGDNDFYSQRAELERLNLPRTLSSLSSIRPFAPQGLPLAQVHKTGLGSSAALITSLVTGLLLHFHVIPSLDPDENRNLAHNAAQFIHCLAQGKVGSGFDVSAAVFGSHLYTRFEPGVLSGLMDPESTENARASLKEVLSPSNKSWNHKIQEFGLPPMTRIMLADVDAGSDTPSLVGKVLKWRKENPVEANDLWNTIDKKNMELADTLLRLSELYANDEGAYTNAVKTLATLPAAEWSANPEDQVTNTFIQAHNITQTIRALMRQMSTSTSVPIEPAEQTRLLDACLNQRGVLGGGVPGAGGYDAIYLLVLDVPESGSGVVRGVDELWAGYEELGVSPLSAVESKGKGVRVEVLDAVKGLGEAIEV